MLAEAERLRARAVADLVEFDAIDGHITDGYLTPQRQLIHAAGVAEAEANRLHRLVRFCADHPAIAVALAAGAVTVDHADILRTIESRVDSFEFETALTDLLDAADGVELSVFHDRVRVWQWRVTPAATGDEIADVHDRRHLTLQPGLFGGLKGSFELDGAGGAVVSAALFTEPDPTDRLEPARTLRQRRADRLVELAGASLLLDESGVAGEAGAPVADDPQPGRRQLVSATVDVVIDLPTLVGAEFDFDDHRCGDGRVDWASIQSAFAFSGQAPRPVLEQFLCDASWRRLVTSGVSIVLDYSHAKPELAASQRRAVQRRDRHCQFDGCDRHWRWCDVHHIRSKTDGGWDLFDNLTLLCRRHHTMVHQGGWQLRRAGDGRLVTTSP